ncbi:MAG TPA: 4-hydroxy-3-methylbut-2-enyl diphosphate reductase [Gemmatimonadaceae bacterium]|nr:4-hydroxy-3-methylbut-2-enyl diphosphate reductase [Gemmatimonadaceae bacterium]
MPDSPVKELNPAVGPPSATALPPSIGQTAGPEVYFRKGFGLKAEVQAELASDYSGRLVDLLRAREYSLSAGDTTVRLAREFGFCYGVERAVDYAYQTRRKFPDRRVLLAGEIIHNPHVNAKLREMGVQILEAGPDGIDYSQTRPEDVVILPAFGVTIQDFQRLRELGCVMVDTTCGSVLNVWKRVENYARDGFTSLIHGKYYHEETRATASQASKYPGAHHFVVRNMAEARKVCDFIEGKLSGAELMGLFPHASSPGFDPDRDLRRIGVANQTTMLAGESLAIGAEIGQAMARAHGDEYARANFRTFDTICSATQERQDAVVELLLDPVDVMVVIGGYNSSNTISLAALCAEKVRTYHVEDAAAIDPDTGTIRHRPAGWKKDVDETGWLSGPGPVRIGMTAGASTPNNKIGDAVARIFATRGISPESIE